MGRERTAGLDDVRSNPLAWADRSGIYAPVWMHRDYTQPSALSDTFSPRAVGEDKVETANYYPIRTLSNGEAMVHAEMEIRIIDS